MNEFLSSVGDRIRVLRKERRLSQEELAFKANLHNTYIGQVERGEKNITITNLKCILDALDIGLDEFFSTFKVKDESSNLIQIINVLKDMGLAEQQLVLNILKSIEIYKSK